MKFSVLSAARDEEKYIAEMIDSVVAQSHESWELLVVDDRSTDSTSAIVAQYADPRVHLVDNSGVHGKNAAFNRAFEHSCGQVVIFLGADDTIPKNSLELRADAMARFDTSRDRVAAFSKVRMFSVEAKFDGVVVPRGQRGSRSGGTTALSRRLAEEVFPLGTTLPNEDVWTSTFVELRAEHCLDIPEIVVNYRIHPNNSFKRDQDFHSANLALHKRGLVYERLLERGGWLPAEQALLQDRATSEELRYSGRTFRLLTRRSVTPVERLRLASQSSRTLYWLRQKSYRLFSGW